MANPRNNELEYKDEHKHERFVSNKHFLHTIEVLNPLSTAYLKYWKDLKRRCFEGYWFEGKWMPGNLYFYVNFWKIELSKDANAKNKIIAKPFLRDLEWEKSYVFAEARGFSGFADDEEESCHRVILATQADPDWKLYFNVPKECFKKDGTLKKFVPAREYLRRIHHKNLGKPLYQNQAWNCIDIECFAPETPVLMYDSSIKLIKDICINDIVQGVTGPKKVINTFIGNSQMYKIKTKRHGEQTVSKGHLVQVEKRIFVNGKYENGKRLKGNWKTEQISYPVEHLYNIQNNPSFTNEYYIYQSQAIEKPHKEVPIDPWVFGLWLSDGRSNGSYITTTDKILIKEIESKCDITFKEIKQPNNWKTRYDINFYKRSELKKLNVLYNKHLPIQYLETSIEQRLNLLAGIIDGDGTYDVKCKNFNIYEPRQDLANSYCQLARSLGFVSSISKRTRVDCNDIFVICIGGDVWKIPTRLVRKRIPIINRRLDYTKSSFHIEKLDINQFVGIEVDGDNLFLLDNYVVVHNCRGTGKTFWNAGGQVGHTFLTDGGVDYDEYLENLRIEEAMSCQILVGAINGTYTRNLLTKVQLGFENLVGAQSFQGKEYPSPLSKKTSGSWFSGKQSVEALVDMKIRGTWKKVGSGSVIHNRSFNDNPLAGNGTRPSLSCLDEVGFMNNLKSTLGAMKDTTYNGPNKFGVIYMNGTGGEMESGAPEQAMEVFNNPAEFDCLVFDDIWEETGSIGFFVPYEMGLNEYKDEEGVTDLVKAKRYVDNKRDVLKKGKAKKPLYDEMQNNPRVPSEAFLMLSANIFPVGELKEQLGWIQSNEHDAFVQGQCGELVFNTQGKVEWKPDLHNKLTPTWFKMNKNDDATGCVQIWEHPQAINGQIPYGMYIAGTDPYDQDQSVHTMSLGSTFIYKTYMTSEGIFEWIVAEYTARPKTVDEHHENVRKLLLYYNAQDLYENERNSLKMHFQHHHSLHLLAKTPTILKATEGSKVQRTYGIHMTSQIKDELEIYVRDWLLKERGDGRLNLHTIYSPALLKELIYYNRDGNFDRFISLALTICHRLMNYHTKVEAVQEEIVTKDSFLERAFSGKFF